MDCIQCEGYGACDKEVEDEGVLYQSFSNMDELLIYSKRMC